MTHDELRELTGAYALGALSDADRHALEAHLPTCGDCAREVRELAAVASGLAVAVPQVDPPAALRARVLRAAVAPAVAQVQPLRSAAPSAPARASALPSLFAGLAAAAALAAVALGLYAMTLRERVGRLEAELRVANGRAEGVERQMQIVQSSADRARQIAGVLDAPDVRAIDLVGQKGAPSAHGRAYWSPSRGLVFTAANLPAPAAGRQYQLWVIPKDSKPVSAGMLDFNDGRTVGLVDPATASRVGVVAVTLEPVGGVAQPTTEPLLVGSL
jgi:anti-sigma-K factor RskA